ncbi:hypothetical protein HMPREF9058_1432 [Actinomyces sp. oral taxon 175 str. F0384]|nr:hypothetical protein HMPREF9058_1432 [Actinomyces sp. oral taxon 175 str. F0384]
MPTSGTGPVRAVGTVRAAGTVQATLPIRATMAALHRSPVAKAGPYHPNLQTRSGLRCSTRAQAVRFLGWRVVPLSRSRRLAVS